jgi:hypothetical protein
MVFLTVIKGAISWAISHQVDVVVMILPLGEFTMDLHYAFDDAASRDTVVIYNAHAPKLIHPIGS